MSNNVKQCRKCGKLFVSDGSPLCVDCMRQMDECFNIIKDYVYDHPQANVAEISEGTGIDSAIVLDFLKQGRLSVSSSDDLLKCENCGKPIVSGRYCEACLQQFENALKGTVKTSKKPLGRMHFGADDNGRMRR